jgi:7-carboxy-7-deazaguanine synthase
VAVETKIKNIVPQKDRAIDKLDISEQFYTVQCEGVSTGVPAFFIRLKACNLMCGGTGGSLMKSGDATWWCDTEAVWRQGIMKPFFRVTQEWDKESITDWVLDGRVHLIWTGGEPTIPRHQKSIIAFLNWVQAEYQDRPDVPDVNIFNELETNGTIPLTDEFSSRIQQINCSVKLANSGMPAARRINPTALQTIMDHDNYWFKFVISNETDIEEIENDFITPFNIPPSKVLMMPGLDSQKDFHERTKFCLEMAKKYGYVGLTRLHVSAWDQLTGV